MDPEVSESEWCAWHCGSRNVIRERIELKHSLEVRFSILKSVRLYASLVERVCELSEYLLHWSVREF